MERIHGRKTLSWGAFRTTLLAVAVALFWLPARPVVACPLPSGILTMARLMEDVRIKNADLSWTYAVRVEGLVSWWRGQEFTTAQLGLGSDAQHAALEQLVDAAGNLVGKSEDRMNQQHRAAILATANAVIAKRCGRGVLAETAEVGAAPDSQMAATRQGRGLRSIAEALPLRWILGGLILALGSCATFLFTKRWGYALLNNRRSCRIQAAFEFGMDVVDGTVTVLSSKGCRFEPVNEGALARFSNLGMMDTVYIQVGKSRLKASPGFIRGGAVAVWFDVPLSRMGQAKLLTRSSIKSRLIPSGFNFRRARNRLNLHLDEDASGADTRLGLPVAAAAGMDDLAHGHGEAPSGAEIKWGGLRGENPDEAETQYTAAEDSLSDIDPAPSTDTGLAGSPVPPPKPAE